MNLFWMAHDYASSTRTSVTGSNLFANTIAKILNSVRDKNISVALLILYFFKSIITFHFRDGISLGLAVSYDRHRPGRTRIAY